MDKYKYIVIENSEEGYIIERFKTLNEAVEYVLKSNNTCEIVRAVDYKINVDEYK